MVALKTEAMRPSEKLVTTYKTTRCNNPEDHHQFYKSYCEGTRAECILLYLYFENQPKNYDLLITILHKLSFESSQ